MWTTDSLHQRLKTVKLGSATCSYTHQKCAQLVPVLNEILELKQEKNAVILAHSYVSPEIVYGVSDFVGDSYKLSKDAMNTEADVIVFAAVRFMAETAKVLNPSKEVLMPSQFNGCTLADSITAQEVKDLRQKHPDFTFMCYVNTTADVKAECDVCVTSGNVYDIVQNHPSSKIFFLPDRLMGENLIDEMQRREVDKEILIHDGTCYVHEEYDPDLIRYMQMEHPGINVLSHPECSPDIIKLSDFVGSTAQMVQHVRQSQNRQFMMLTECGLSARMQVEMPDREFLGTCTMCRYMKSNSLQGILRVLKNPQPEDRVSLDPNIGNKARKCLDAMFTYTTR